MYYIYDKLACVSSFWWWLTQAFLFMCICVCVCICEQGSRRMKTELLIQMDGLHRSNDMVFVLAASNLPWELDGALPTPRETRTC